MNSLQKMAQNEDEIRVIASIYLTYVLYSNYSRKSSIRIQTLIYIHRVEEALSSLNERYRELIKNDFIDVIKPFWWKTRYSSTAYLNLRERAVGSFLMHFYEN